ncbi:hypothetical protein LTR37_008279 [Vermiconidia calcicola]|uniref:Uncharacterized protein n=1 Tax=Vermiconidia calcicola TaxID=1690605 RepID=A0ACC3NBS8_9PEZI|nr:hypothetical protein LTR37_008279 [Vermiconidia calcicola]
MHVLTREYPNLLGVNEGWTGCPEGNAKPHSKPKKATDPEGKTTKPKTKKDPADRRKYKVQHRRSMANTPAQTPTPQLSLASLSLSPELPVTPPNMPAMEPIFESIESDSTSCIDPALDFGAGYVNDSPWLNPQLVRNTQSPPIKSVKPDLTHSDGSDFIVETLNSAISGALTCAGTTEETVLYVLERYTEAFKAGRLY